MLQAGWLILHLIAGAMPALSGAPVPAGMSCTYAACMTRCGGLNRQICNSYCEARITQRVATGVCVAPVDPAVRPANLQ
ncbi:hypothetical protein BH10PSE10_BH10PSE10_08280 [soil metagenome]